MPSVEIARPSGVTTPIQHHKRDYPAEDHGAYALPHDDVERDRLMRQHTICKNIFGGKLIFPHISFDNGGNILDSGAGTGVWILDVTKNVPKSVELYGIDIGSRLWPAEAPSNVHFSINSVFHLPLEWGNKFTLIHQRLLVCALRVEEWKAACKEMYRVASPGGWVQFTEIEPWRLTSFGGGPCVRRVISMIRDLFTTTGLLMEISDELPSFLQDVGFVDVVIEEGRVSPGDRSAQEEGQRNTIAVMRALKTSILDLGGLGHVNSEEEFDAMLDDMETETETLPEGALIFNTIYAKKLSGL